MREVLGLEQFCIRRRRIEREFRTAQQENGKYTMKKEECQRYWGKKNAEDNEEREREYNLKSITFDDDGN